MKLIIGGAYQGKTDFARRKWNLSEEDIFICSGTEVDFSRPCIASIEEFTYACVQNHLDSLQYWIDHRQQWERSILICQDLSSGVVPLGADLRAWRQDTGLLCQYLSKEAESVSRIFCGLEQKLK